MKWKEGKIFSLELRNGKFVLLQLLKRKTEIAVFNFFNEDNKWHDNRLTKNDILFMTNLETKRFFKKSKLTLQSNIQPLENYEFPTKRISIGIGNRKIKLWKNTEYEIELIVIGEGNNLLSEENESTRFREYSPISTSEYTEYAEYEIEGLNIYPEFNERLLLCSAFGKNFDPMKEIAFNRDLDIKCNIYAKIISGKYKLDSLGY